MDFNEKLRRTEKDSFPEGRPEGRDEIRFLALVKNNRTAEEIAYKMNIVDDDKVQEIVESLKNKGLIE